MIETRTIEEWLFSTLVADAPLQALVSRRIYAHQAPPDAAFPFVVFSPQSVTDVAGLGPARVISVAVYQVRVVGRGPSFVTIEPVLDRIDSVLLAAPGVPGPVQGVQRDGLFAFLEAEDGAQYAHLGGYWRLFARKE